MLLLRYWWLSCLCQIYWWRWPCASARLTWRGWKEKILGLDTRKARLHRRTLCYSRIRTNAQVLTSAFTALLGVSNCSPTSLNHYILVQCQLPCTFINRLTSWILYKLPSTFLTTEALLTVMSVSIFDNLRRMALRTVHSRFGRASFALVYKLIITIRYYRWMIALKRENSKSRFCCTW